MWIPLPSCRFASSHLPQGDGFSGGGKLCGSAIRRPLGGAGCERSEQTEGVLPAACALSVTCGDTLPLLSLRDIFPRPGEVGPQGDGFSGGDKVSGSAIRRPLGGAGCERSEQTEGVLPAAPERVLLPQKATRKLTFQRTYVNKSRISKNCKIF